MLKQFVSRGKQFVSTGETVSLRRRSLVELPFPDSKDDLTILLVYTSPMVCKQFFICQVFSFYR